MPRTRASSTPRACAWRSPSPASTATSPSSCSTVHSRALKAAGASDGDVSVWWVPGAFELPVVAKRLADSGRVDAVVCLGAVIRGDTAHFEYVAGGATQGLVQAAVSTGVPVIFGVLTVDSREQALARVGGSEGHKGEEAANTAIETVRLLQQL